MSIHDVTTWVRKASPHGNWVVWISVGFLETPLTTYGSKSAALAHARQIRSAIKRPVGLFTRARS